MGQQSAQHVGAAPAAIVAIVRTPRIPHLRTIHQVTRQGLVRVVEAAEVEEPLGHVGREAAQVREVVQGLEVVR